MVNPTNLSDLTSDFRETSNIGDKVFENLFLFMNDNNWLINIRSLFRDKLISKF